MRAITYDRYGPPDVFRLADVPTPTPSPGGVLVKVAAASVNAFDWHLLRGKPYLARMSEGLRTPKRNIPLVDVAGTVVAVGPEVTDLAVGDEVFANKGRSAAEYVSGPARLFAPRPASLSPEEAAAVPAAAITALQALRDQGHIQPGQSVLVHGAGGGVGTFTVQVARALGAGEITGVTRTENLDLVRSIGADHVIDYTSEDVTRRPERYDLIIDNGATRPLLDATAPRARRDARHGRGIAGRLDRADGADRGGGHRQQAGWAGHGRVHRGAHPRGPRHADRADRVGRRAAGHRSDLSIGANRGGDRLPRDDAGARQGRHHHLRRVRVLNARPRRGVGIERTTVTMRTWATGMAIVGLALLGVEAILVAPASAPFASQVIGGHLIGLQSTILQVLLVGAILIGLTAGLAMRSRVAFTVAFLIGLVPVSWWMVTFASGAPIARQPMTILVITPPLLVLIGLIEAWPAFWEPVEETDPDGSGVSTTSTDSAGPGMRKPGRGMPRPGCWVTGQPAYGDCWRRWTSHWLADRIGQSM